MKITVLIDFYLIVCLLSKVLAQFEEEESEPSLCRGDACNENVEVTTEEAFCSEELEIEEPDWWSQALIPSKCNVTIFDQEQQENVFVFDQSVTINGQRLEISNDDSFLSFWSNTVVHMQDFYNLRNFTEVKEACSYYFSNENVIRMRLVINNPNQDFNLTHDKLLESYKRNKEDENEESEIYEVDIPVDVTSTCPKNLMCGENARCSTVLNQPACRCFNGYAGNPHQNQKCYGVCKDRQTCGFTFSNTWAGSIAISKENCSTGLPQASAECQEVVLPDGRQGFSFLNIRPIDCQQNIDSVLTEALSSATSQQQFDEYSSNLYVFSRNSSRFSDEEAESIVGFLEEVSNTETALNADTSFRSLASVASEMMQGYLSTNARQQRNLSLTLARSLPKMAIRSELRNNQTEFRWSSEAVSLQTNQLNENLNGSLGYSPILRAKENGSSSFQPISLEIPTSALEKAREQQHIASSEKSGLRTAFLYYRSDVLFASNGTASNVLSVNIGDNITLSNLEEPVIIEHLNINAKYGKEPLQGVRLMVNRTTMQCVYWDFPSSTWSPQGCCLNTSSGSPVCQCNHLTNFAIVVRSENIPANFELEVVSTIGCILSITGLLATITIMASRKDLRKFQSSKVLLHICCNLLIVYIIFIAGVSNAVGNEAGCIVVTTLLHYFFLTTWCWMAIYSYEMYNSLVKVFVQYKGGFMTRSFIFSYLFPAIVALVTVGVSTGFSIELRRSEGLCDVEDPLAVSSYHADTACWLKGDSLYFGFLLPVGLILTYNCCTFGLVTYELNRQKGASEQLKRATIDSLLIAITMTFIIGIAWIFGYILLISTDSTFHTVMSWLFTIFNTLQGFGIFVLTSVRREDMRNVWWKPIKNSFRRRASHSQESHTYPSSSSRSHHHPYSSERKQSTRTQFIVSDAQVSC